MYINISSFYKYKFQLKEGKGKRVGMRYRPHSPEVGSFQFVTSAVLTSMSMVTAKLLCYPKIRMPFQLVIYLNSLPASVQKGQTKLKDLE